MRFRRLSRCLEFRKSIQNRVQLDQLICLLQHGNRYPRLHIYIPFFLPYDQLSYSQPLDPSPHICLSISLTRTPIATLRKSISGPRTLALPLPCTVLALDLDTANPEFSLRIIAVHGLGGHPKDSWTYTEAPREPPQTSKPTNKPHSPSTTDANNPSSSTPIITEGPNFPHFPAPPPTPPPVDPVETLWLAELLPTPMSAIPGVDLKDQPLLKDGIKKARIRTFGYDSTRAAGEDKTLYGDLIRPVALELLKAVNGGYGWDELKSEEAEEINKVPLVFVAMDIGGSIVKEVGSLRFKPQPPSFTEFTPF